MATQKIFSRNLILSFFAQFTFSSVSNILIPTLPIYLSKFAAKEAEIGFLIGIFSISSLILRPFVGRSLLNISGRKFMMGGTLLYAICSVAYLLVPPFWPLLIVRVFQGVGLAFFSTAIYTLVADITPEDHRGKVISYFYLPINMSFALGPYFGMLLINRFNFRVLFSVCIGLSLCSLYITTKLSQMKTVPLEKPSLKLQSLLSREALPSALMAFMINIIWGSLNAFLPLYGLKHGISNPGIFFTFLAITLILGRAFGGKLLDIYGRERVIMPCLITVMISIAILTFSTTLAMFILAAVILGAGLALLYPSLLIHAIEKAGSVRGPAMGTFTAVADLGIGLGPMIMGIILQWTSYWIMFFCLILISVINLFYYYTLVKGKEGG